MIRRNLSPLTLSLLCPLLALACDAEDIADSGAEPPDDSEGEIKPRSNQIPVACQSLTPAAIQAPVTKIDESIVQLNEYLATTPTSVYDPNAGYNVLGTIALGHLDQAKAKITGYQAWLTSINHGNPFVFWEGAVPFFEMTDAAHSLHHATWWAYLGMGYDKKEVARQSAKRAGEAQRLASDLGRQGLLCAMEQYFNCGDGNLDTGENCDDGNLIDADGCSHTCQPDGGTCGNGVINPGEACDDGNSFDNDGCAQCQPLTPWPLQPENPCAALTPAAIQHSLDLTDEAIDFIDEYLTETPVSNYANAGQYALDYYEEAKAKITGHQAYLAGIPHGDPYVSWESVAQGTWEAMMDAAWSLRYGAWWGHIATAYDHKPESRMAVRRAFAAQELVDHLGRQALLCTMSTYALCSDGVVNGTEQCDDGNLVAGDGCSSTCTTEAVCGDGVVAGEEECDDGDLQNGDGCEDTCTETVSGGKIFLTQGGTNIYQFNIGTNSWAQNPITIPAINTSYATITNDGRYVYRILDSNNTSNPNDVGHPIDRLDTTNNTWQQNWMAGPPTQAPCSYSRRDQFAWVGDGFYLVDNYCVDPNTTSFTKVWRKNDGDVDWTLVTTFAGNTTGQGTWDLDSDKLYSYSRYAGGYGWSTYDVFDTSSNALLSTHTDWTFDHGSFGYGRAFSRGGFYAHARDQANNWTMWFEKLDSNDSPILQETVSTGQAFNPGEDAAWGVDPATGVIYVFANFYMNNMPPGLRSYNPETNVMTNSIPLPGGGGTLSGSNLTVLRPLAE